MSDELKRMLEQVHQGITTFDFEGKDTPCIIVDAKKYGLIRAKIEGQLNKLTEQLITRMVSDPELLAFLEG